VITLKETNNTLQPVIRETKLRAVGHLLADSARSMVMTWDGLKKWMTWRFFGSKLLELI